MRYDFKKGINVGYGFVNFTEPEPRPKLGGSGKRASKRGAFCLRFPFVDEKTILVCFERLIFSIQKSREQKG